MLNFSYKLIYQSAFLVLISTAGGYALTEKLAGTEAARMFLTVGSSVVLCILILEAAFYLPGRSRLLYQLLFAVVFGSSVVWFVICLFLPLFWVKAIPVAAKLLIGIAALAVCCWNYMQAFRQFSRKWRRAGKRCFARSYDSETSVLDWQKVVVPMRLSVKLCLPGLPPRAIPLVEVALVLSMLIGLSFRKLFPVFSVFAWGIPSAILASVVVQMAGLSAAQVLKVRELEKAVGIKLKPKR